MYEVRKYKANGQWSAWKAVDEKTAMQKATVVVRSQVYGFGDDEPDYVDYFHPYEVRKVED